MNMERRGFRRRKEEDSEDENRRKVRTEGGGVGVE